jgi:tetratricopeptide (TPR) repeat protein
VGADPAISDQGTRHGSIVMALPSNDNRRPLRFRPRRVVVTALIVVVIVLVGFLGYPSVLAWYHFRAAQSAAQRHDLNAEYSHLLKCLKGWPNSPEVYLQAARAARHLGQLKEAEHFLGHYSRLNGSSIDASVERLLLKLAHHDPNLDPRRALESLRQAPDDQPTVPEALEALSKFCLSSYRLHDAKAALLLWIERDPENATPYLLSGWVAEQLSSNVHPALPDYRRAVELEPDNITARMRLAESLVKTRQSAEALPELELLHQRQPTNPVVLLNLALCREDLGDIAEAAQLLDDLLSSQRLALLQKMSDRLHHDQPPPEEAEKASWYQQAMALAPYGNQGQPGYVIDLHIQALVERGKLAGREKRDPLPFLRQAEKLDPFDATTIYHLSLCLERQGKREEAKQIQTRLAAIRADHLRIQEAVVWVVRAPDDPLPRCIAAEILMRNGQPKEALRWLRGALQINPKDPEALRLMNVYRRQTRQRGQASSPRSQTNADDPVGSKEGGHR